MPNMCKEFFDENILGVSITREYWVETWKKLELYIERNGFVKESPFTDQINTNRNDSCIKLLSIIKQKQFFSMNPKEFICHLLSLRDDLDRYNGSILQKLLDSI